MALVLLGQSKCPLCGAVLKEGDELFGFPAIVSNTKDPLFELNDRAFHARCFFGSHPLAREATARLHLWEERTSPLHMCHLCRTFIADPDEHFVFDHFTDDSTDPLFPYSYAEFHRSCLQRWSELPTIIAAIDRLRQSGTWEGDSLNRLVRELRDMTRKGEWGSSLDS